MNIRLFSLTMAAVCSLPIAGLAQGTYLSDPANPSNHAFEVAPGGNLLIGGNRAFTVNYFGLNSLTINPFNDWPVTTMRGPVGIGNFHDTFVPLTSLHLVDYDPELRIQQWPGSPGGATLNLLAAGNGTNKAHIIMNSLTLESASGGGGDHLRIYNETHGELVYFHEQGNVGIGTTSPQGRLEVSGTYPQLRLSNPGFGSGIEIDFVDVGVLRQRIGGMTDSRYLQFGTGGSDANGTGLTPRMTIDNFGNVGVGTTTPQAKLDVAGKINCTVLELTSDRAQKSGFAPVDRRAILDQVARLPITTWQYTNEPAVRHIGPMAQDFKAAFSVGSDDKHIATVDADGVLFAAVQALHQFVEEKDARIAALETKLARQEQSLAACLAAVEKLVAQSASPSKTTLAANASKNESSLPSQNLNQENP